MSAASLLRKALVGLLVLAPLVLPAQAQTGTGTRPDGASNPLDQLRQRVASTGASASGVPLEGAVDPQAYVVGPGDVFSVTAGGLGATAALIPVTADGQLVLPDAGSVEVAGLTLAEARTRALEALRAQYRNVPLAITLAQPRQFYVHVSGAVPVPGRYLAVPVGRVASVLEIAFADTSRAPVANPNFRPSLRNVELTRRDGTTTSLDLVRYFVTGDTEANPYLRDGDILHVPAYTPEHRSLYIDGDVPYPGSYDFRPGDTVRDLLVLGTGDEVLDGAATLRLSRTGGTEVLTAEAVRSGATNPALQPGDHVYVRRTEAEGGTATVEGYVQYPGTYPIEPGVTTLEALIERAGGLRPDALARAAYLERAALPAPTARTTQPNRFSFGPAEAALVRTDTAAVMQRLRLTDLDLPSRRYFTQEMRLQNRVSVDLARLLSDAEAAIPLFDGDRLVVPRDEQTVYVFGQVIRPGYVPYQPEQSLADYLAAAGGRGSDAGATYVIEAGSGRYLTAEDAEIGSGDVIFVDRREDVADTPELQRLVLEEERARTDQRFRTFQAVLQAAGLVASTITTIILIGQRN